MIWQVSAQPWFNRAGKVTMLTFMMTSIKFLSGIGMQSITGTEKASIICASISELTSHAQSTNGVMSIG